MEGLNLLPASGKVLCLFTESHGWTVTRLGLSEAARGLWSLLVNRARISFGGRQSRVVQLFLKYKLKSGLHPKANID